MYEDSSPIGSLVHLYFDGAFSRRELVRRVAGHTGSIAAAAAVLMSMGVAEAQQLACPDDVRVPEDAADLVMQDVQFPGDAGPIFAYMAQPRTDDPRSEEHTSELQSRLHLVCRLLIDKK